MRTALARRLKSGTGLRIANAFARRSCSNEKMTDEHDSTQLTHAPDIPAVTKSKAGYPQRYAGPGQSIIERVLFSAS